MTTLLIKDLAIASDLDRSAMASVSGGYYKAPGSYMPSVSLPTYDKSGYGYSTDFKFDASQAIGQSQNVLNNNGNNVAFVDGISSTVNPTQTADNSINF